MTPEGVVVPEPEFPILKIESQDERSTKFFTQVWMKCLTVLGDYHRSIVDSPPGWCNWQVAQWAKEEKPDDQLRFAAWEGKVMVGFLNLRIGFPSRSEPGKHLVYIEHLATAPGNMWTLLWGRRFHGVGRALMAFAVLESMKSGCEGRIGLHAADEFARDWYSRLSTPESGPMFTHQATGVPGPKRSKRTDLPNLTDPYLESNTVSALELLEGYRVG